MYLEKDEILHLTNKKNYKVINFELVDDICYYLLKNIDNNKFIVVTCSEISSELYLKEVKDENILNNLKF